MYEPQEGPEPSSFALVLDLRRADTFLLALSLACGFTVLDKVPLGSGRDLPKKTSPTPGPYPNNGTV